MQFKTAASKTALNLLSLLFFMSLFLTTAHAQSSSARSSTSETPGQLNYSESGFEFSMQVPPLWVVEKGAAGYAAVLKPSPKAPRLKLPRGVVADPTYKREPGKKRSRDRRQVCEGKWPGNGFSNFSEEYC
jgi:hypothetical protein